MGRPELGEGVAPQGVESAANPADDWVEGEAEPVESGSCDVVLSPEGTVGLRGMYVGEPSAVEVSAGEVRKLLGGKRPGRGAKLVKPPVEPVAEVTVEQKVMVLDLWKRSGLPAGDFSAVVGVNTKTLYIWKKRFDEEGPAGLVAKPKGCPSGSRLPEMTKRAIVMMKEANPEWGCQRISDMLARGPGYPASAAAIAKVLHEAGYQTEEAATRPHEAPVRRFERAKPNQLWQTDLFTFILKRQNRRVYMVLFMDDHSRFIVGYGVHGASSAAMVMEVLEAAIASFQAPEELLTDNGPQYVTWRGTSAFAKLCQKRGIKQIVARPRRPQTLGKAERFWGTLWREFLETAIFLDLEDARRRIGLFIDHYNFQRPHQGLNGATPAERYFGVASEVLGSMKKRLQANALELARNGVPKQPFFLTGQIGGKPFTLHAEGERVYLLQEGGAKKEVELVTPHGNGTNADAPDCEATALDEGLPILAASAQEKAEVGHE
jgi:transposase InsO family protein